jgi:23S rRNA pseudouridine1911/1915/1917 synthase
MEPRRTRGPISFFRENTRIPEQDTMSETQTFTFQIQDPGERLDKAIAFALPDLSRATIQRLIKSSQVTVDGRASKPSYRVELGDEIVVHMPVEKAPDILPEHIALQVVFEDAHLLAVSKPAGMVVHPAYGHHSGTLVNAILALCPEAADVGGLERAGIVHRLDKDTSGLILVAKSEATRAALQRQFKRRQVKKSYLALVEGHPSPRQGLIDAPIGRDKRQRKRMAIVRSGREARTGYRVIELFGEHSLVELQPETGRTHQIRVHLAWLGHPVVGDQVYGYCRQRLLQHRHFLHAHKLELVHPITSASLSLTAPLPDDLADLLRRLRR